ncbi:hypothetical protein L6R53_32725 [Myxococcota bacterium]|nr:hypothetical protein [Myxococcota bacterium]
MQIFLILASAAHAATWYADADGDGYGDPTMHVEDATAPDGYVGDASDCDDDNAASHPGGTETCDGSDNDCAGGIDDGEVCPCDVEEYGDHAYMFCETLTAVADAQAFCQDYDYNLATLSSADEDTWVDGQADARSTEKWWLGGNDSTTEGTWAWVDGSDWVYENWHADEPNDSGGNEDCLQHNRYTDGVWNDEPCTSTFRFVCESGLVRTLYVDADGDGYGDPASATLTSSDSFDGYSDNALDCNDGASEVNPSQAETWYDGVDADCDGQSDYDADEDGWDSDLYGGEDCDDGDDTVNPAAVDEWYDGVDADCDGESDYDADGDGQDSDLYGGRDCDDGDEGVYDGATETWYDGTDADCDGESD